MFCQTWGMLSCFLANFNRDWAKVPQSDLPAFLEPSPAPSYQKPSSRFLQGVDEMQCFHIAPDLFCDWSYKIICCISSLWFCESADAHDTWGLFIYLGVENRSAFHSLHPPQTSVISQRVWMKSEWTVSTQGSRYLCRMRGDSAFLLWNRHREGAVLKALHRGRKG